MKEFLKKNWIPIAAVLIVIIVLVVVYYQVYASGKQSGTSSALASIPNPTLGEAYTNDERLSIENITTQLKAMLSGFGWKYLWSDYSAITNLDQASQRVQIGVYEQYNMDTKSNLITDINSLVSLNPDFDALRSELLAKLNNEITGQ